MMVRAEHALPDRQMRQSKQKQRGRPAPYRKSVVILYSIKENDITEDII